MAYVDCLSSGRSFAREMAIARHVETVIDVDSERIRSLPRKADCALFASEFEKFASFAESIGVGVLPATGHVCALYIFDLLASGASLDEIGTAVASIEHAHKIAGVFLDWMPIHAALDFVAAEMA